jgi:hypothetical protein
MAKELMILTFLVVLALSLVVLLGGPQVRRGWVAARDGTYGAPALRRHGRRLAQTGGDWPHTTRVLPWMIAAFLVVLWLVPFNQIQLTVSLPFDMKFDRLILPILLGTWVLALATGGPGAPRVRTTLIHVGIGLFVTAASLSILVSAHSMVHSLDFNLAVKKLSLLLCYALLFLIIASSVRRTEVPAFMKYTLWLAVLCAIGTVWEYRFHYNVFHDLSDKLLPGFFQVGSVDSTEVDEIGRVMTRGPAEHPLETVAMLSMAFPIAIVGIIHSKERRRRMFYSLAAVLLLAGAISTYRKSALLAPVSAVLTIAYFRRRELLKLAPLGVLSLAATHAVSPGALGSILFQLHPNRLGVSTVSDRTADYDAVRPDLWTHLFFGRGYGTYDHVAYRVLDSEVLSRLLDVGIVGLVCLFLMLGFIVMAARGLIRARHPLWSPPALSVAAAAVAFFVLAFLFDVTAFPHTPYILFALAGFLAVLVRDPEGGHDDAPEPAELGRALPPPEFADLPSDDLAVPELEPLGRR